MKSYFLSFLILMAFIGSCKSQELKLMTYNIRLDVASDGENAWPNRKDFLSSQVLFLAPDILGVQEALPNQVNDLKKALTAYQFIGEGRDGGQNGEHSGIFYNSKRVEVAEVHTFWLSTTPDTVSKDWDAALPRISTYGLFTLKESKQKVWVFNTHFDHVGAIARKESIKLILEKIKEVNTKNFPVILMGDFNVEPTSEVMTLAKTIFNDSREEASIVFGPEGTFTGFNYNNPVTRRIDYILVSKEHILVEKYATLSSAIDFKFPSDHFPIFVQLSIK